MNSMTLAQYQELAARTLPQPRDQHFFTAPLSFAPGKSPDCHFKITEERQRFNQATDLLHAALGLTSEVGELADPIKKAMFYGKPLDVENIKEEAGDLLWYLAGPLCRALGCTLEELAAANIAKLKARYPGTYSDHAAIARADKTTPP